MKRVLTNKITREDYINNEELRNLITWRFTLNPELDDMNKLIEREEELDKKYEEILFLIKRFSFLREREIDAMNLLRLSSEQNSDYLTLNFSWARLSDSLSNETAYRYFLTDENYKNRLFTHWKKAIDYTNIISSYRANILIILTKLKSIREAYTPLQLEAFFIDLSLKSFEKIEVNKSLIEIHADDALAKSSLIANLSKDTLGIIVKNKKGDELHVRKFPPGEISMLRTSKIDLYDNEIRIIEVYKEGLCIEKYKEVQNGYLIMQ